MLLHRSILIKVCLLLVVCLVKAQYEYDNEEKKEVKEKEEEDDRDYAKIFAEETSAALTAAVEDPDNPEKSDYVVPVEFETYFTPAHIFGESNKEPVKAAPQKKKEPLQPYESKKEDYSSYYDDEPVKETKKNKNKEPLKTFESKNADYAKFFDDGPLKDFFYDSDKKKQKLQKEQSKTEEEVIPPGPSYISHQVPAHYNYEDDEDDKSTSASEDVERAPSKKNNQKSTPGANFEEGRVEKNEEDYKLPPITFEAIFKNNKPKVDYDTGKSSSTVSQYPQASGYHKAAASTPYEKYSFQPAEEYEAENSKFFDSILSTVAPYNPSYNGNSEPKYESQPSEDSPSQVQGKGCRKVASSSDDMNCFICENPKTNAKYTQCSYSSQKKPENYFEGSSAQYSMPNKEEASSYRYKRYADNDENDPYTYIRNRARKASHDSGIPSDYGSGFSYEAEHYDESKPELTFSEQHSEEIKKNPENCQKVDKEGMTCTVCKDPKTGGNFEQCSYTSKPKEKKYAYVTEKKFDNDEPLETQVISQTKAAESKEKEKSDGSSKKNVELFEEYQNRKNQEKNPKKRNEEGRDYDAKASEKKSDEESYEFPSHFVKTISSPSYKDSIYKGSSSELAKNVDKKKSDDFSDFDEYHFKYFPEFAKQESRQEPVQESYNIPAPEATKQNVESVLAEFSKKDRSNCKKAQKKGMTCYLCVDKNNIQNEECMYVQESKPENTHVAYHEVKATEKGNAPEPEKNKTKESTQETKQAITQESKQEPAAIESRPKYFFRNVPTPAPLLGLEVAASEEVGTFVRYDPDREAKKKKRSSKKAKEDKELKSDASAYDAERIDDKADPTIKTPEEFNVGPGEGAFSDETKAIYSKELGIHLPKYMLEKSEFEKEFDAFSGSF